MFLKNRVQVENIQSVWALNRVYGTERVCFMFVCKRVKVYTNTCSHTHTCTHTSADTLVRLVHWFGLFYLVVCLQSFTFGFSLLAFSRNSGSKLKKKRNFVFFFSSWKLHFHDGEREMKKNPEHKPKSQEDMKTGNTPPKHLPTLPSPSPSRRIISRKQWDKSIHH